MTVKNSAAVSCSMSNQGQPDSIPPIPWNEGIMLQAWKFYIVLF